MATKTFCNDLMQRSAIEGTKEDNPDFMLEANANDDVVQSELYNPRLDLENYKFPHLDLLIIATRTTTASTWRNRTGTRTASSRCSAASTLRSVPSRQVWDRQ